jgi:predicted  nucleic acid-binding Zn-ribbon protein
VKKALEAKGQELSKLSKEKLKLEHHLNNIRKKEIAQELTPEDRAQQEKQLTERNEFLSLRQQVETLMAKRDELRKALREAELLLEEERQVTQKLQAEVARLNAIQSELDEKYELVRECSVE